MYCAFYRILLYLSNKCTININNYLFLIALLSVSMFILILREFLITYAEIGEGRGMHRVLVGKPEGKRPLGRPRRRWEDNIKTNLQEVGGGCGDLMDLGQDRNRWRALVSAVMNFRVP
jgi:hypothetical protein